MNLAEASLMYVVSLIMNDLQSHIENKGRYLSDEARSDIVSWFEWAKNDVTKNEKKIIEDTLNSSLDAMNIWSDEQEELNQIFNKIKNYFDLSYGENAVVGFFSEMVLNKFKRELLYDDINF